MSPYMEERVPIALEPREPRIPERSSVGNRTLVIAAVVIVSINNRSSTSPAATRRLSTICTVVTFTTTNNNTDTTSPTLLNSEPNLTCALTCAPPGSDPRIIVI